MLTSATAIGATCWLTKSFLYPPGRRSPARHTGDHAHDPRAMTPAPRASQAVSHGHPGPFRYLGSAPSPVASSWASWSPLASADTALAASSAAVYAAFMASLLARKALTSANSRRLAT